jgi:L-aspartate oxidase
MLEVLVFSKRILEKSRSNSAGTIVKKPAADEFHTLPRRKMPDNVPELTASNLQSLMWDKVGIIRNRQTLMEAVQTLAAWQRALPPTAERASQELSNMVITGRLISEAALIREESRGAHFRSDFPQKKPEWQHHVVFKLK